MVTNGRFASHLCASAALVAAGVIAVAPVAPEPHLLTVNPLVRLTASSIANIPANLVTTIANAPANEVKAIQALADALNYGGNWWLVNPLNVLGIDPADPPKVNAIAAVLVPIPSVSGSLAKQLNIIVQAEIPMNAGCAGIPTPCENLGALVGGYFQVPLSQLLAGYVFPTIVNPAQWPDGTTTEVPWSGQSVQLKPFEPITSLVESLMEEPSGIEVVPLWQVADTAGNLLVSLNNAFNPYVPGSYGTDPKTGIFGALEPVLGWTAPDPDEAVPTSDSVLPHTPVHTITLNFPTMTTSGADIGKLALPGSVVTGLRTVFGGSRPAGGLDEVQTSGGDRGKVESQPNEDAPDDVKALKQPATDVGQVAEESATGGDTWTRRGRQNSEDSPTPSRRSPSGVVKSVRDRLSSAFTEAKKGPDKASITRRPARASHALTSDIKGD